MACMRSINWHLVSVSAVDEASARLMPRPNDAAALVVSLVMLASHYRDLINVGLK